ncbi:DNA cytosine methyltransferase [Cytobacillus sp. IB215665]|uniref:DNA cytosine methyltransferase n=1 Tax=Cytobacillus sp. IB215665 TaxID=3097357 RepID=UPI002A14E89A|nr:DNA cytosine methyltransferase [Cytobacillus sp. IB215665]MDX8367698.1 DNA cytosine methyltransferase [Cytobacillus sp. IB215665]
MKILKQFLSKNPERVYIHNLALKEAGFEPGERYKYVVDIEQQKVVILPSDNGEGNKICKRKVKDGYKPVIDIRNQKALSIFKGSKYLQITVLENEVIVEGYVESEENENTSIFNKIASKVTGKVSKKTAKVVDINQFLKVKKHAEVVLSKKQLENAVGSNNHHMSFEDIAWDVSASSNKNSESYGFVKKALKNLHIPLQVVSLFSGAGILDFAFKKAGFDILYAVEKSVAAAKTYMENIGKHIHVGSITDLCKNAIAKASVIIGGIPCTSFSKVNMKKRLVDHPDFYLFKEYIDTVKANENCKVFMIENVEEFITSMDGYIIKEIQQELSDYEITYGVLNSADYGTPMIRKRAIIIGSKIGKIDLPQPSITDKEKYSTVAEALEGLTDDIPNQLDFNSHKPLTIERMKHVPQGGNHWDIPEKLRTFKGKFSVFHKRLSMDKPSISLVHPRKSLITHPLLNRVVSVRECSRIFGLPDEFVFFGQDGDSKSKQLDAKQQQIVNGVPVNLGKAVANAIKKAIMQFNIRNKTATFQKLDFSQ